MEIRCELRVYNYTGHLKCSIVTGNVKKIVLPYDPSVPGILLLAVRLFSLRVQWSLLHRQCRNQPLTALYRKMSK